MPRRSARERGYHGGMILLPDVEAGDDVAEARMRTVRAGCRLPRRRDHPRPARRPAAPAHRRCPPPRGDGPRRRARRADRCARRRDALARRPARGPGCRDLAGRARYVAHRDQPAPVPRARRSRSALRGVSARCVLCETPRSVPRRRQARRIAGDLPQPRVDRRRRRRAATIVGRRRCRCRAPHRQSSSSANSSTKCCPRCASDGASRPGCDAARG